MTAKHTPGPLCITERSPSHSCYGNGAIECLIHVGESQNKGNAIAIIGLGGKGGTSVAPEDVRANARIFAASPALLDALKEAIPILEFDERQARHDAATCHPSVRHEFERQHQIKLARLQKALAALAQAEG